MPTIMGAFEGLELKELGDDKKENVALASAITLLMLKYMKENGKNYTPTAIDFVKHVSFPSTEGESEFHAIPQIDQEILDQYIRDVSEPTARAALAIQSKVNQHQDAYLILSMLHFSMFILSSTLNVTTTRQLVINLLENN